MNTSTLGFLVSNKIDRMRDIHRQQVKNALDQGARVLVLGQYKVGLAVILRVTVPEHWHGKEKHLECTVPDGKLAATLFWVNQNYPDAAIELKS